MTDSLKKTLRLGKIEGRKRRGRQRTRWLDGIIDPVDTSLSKLRGTVKYKEARRAAVHGVIKSQTRRRDQPTTSNDQRQRGQGQSKKSWSRAPVQARECAGKPARIPGYF